jgi:hypothetical protein
MFKQKAKKNMPHKQKELNNSRWNAESVQNLRAVLPYGAMSEIAKRLNISLIKVSLEFRTIRKHSSYNEAIMNEALKLLKEVGIDYKPLHIA